jgi:hypothetical protein
MPGALAGLTPALADRAMANDGPLADVLAAAYCQVETEYYKD